MSKVTILSKPNRIVIASKGVQGPPGPTGDLTPELIAARDAAVAAASGAASSESAAQGYASTASGAADAASQSAGAAAASESAAGGSATTASAAATTASNAADTATSAATAASGSASAAAASESAASGSATTATGAASTAATAAATATQAAGDAQDSAASAADSANEASTASERAVQLSLGEYTVFIEDDDAITAGGYPVTRSARYAGTMVRFYGEVLEGTSATVTIEINGDVAHGPVVINGAPVEQTISLAVQKGDRVTYNVVANAKRLWLQMDGGEA